jgi:dynein heavy chain 1
MGIRATPELVEPSTLLNESSFLNKVQSEVNSWIKEIQNVTKLSRDVSSGTASQEINFWLSMEKALEGIEEQLRSEPINLTLEILKHAKRFHATVSFIADTGLKESTDVVHKYNLLMKDFPLNELLAATDLDKIHDSLISVFNHLNKKLKLSPYPIKRALPLVEAISKDLTEQLLRVLNAQKLMYASFPTFESNLATVASIFNTWDDLIKEFTNVAREVTRKRSEKFLPIKINAYHIVSGFKARIEYLRNFRKHHQQLVGMVSPTKGVGSATGASASGQMVAKDSAADVAGLGLLGGLDMQEEVRLAWEEVKNVDVLDTSEEGTQIWVTAETA